MSEELVHWGIKGMKWGRRRYQNKDGSLTPAGKKRYAKLEGELDSLKGPSEKKSEEDYATAKAKAIKSGSAAEVLKYKGDLTQQEMQSIQNRLRWEHDMADTAQRDAIAAKGKSKIDQMNEKLDKAVKTADTVAKTWNTAANFINAFGDLEVSLPKIDTNVQNGNRNQRKLEQKKAKEEAKKQKEEEKQEKKEAKQAEKDSKQKQNGDTTKSNDSAKQEQTKTESKAKPDDKPTETIDLKDYLGPSPNLPVSQIKDSPFTEAGRSWIEELLEEQSRSGGH